MSNPISMYVPTKLFHGEALLFLSELCFFFLNYYYYYFVLPIFTLHQHTTGHQSPSVILQERKSVFCLSLWWTTRVYFSKIAVLLINKQKHVPQVSPLLPLAKAILVSCLNLPATPLISKLSTSCDLISYDNLHYQKHWCIAL